METTVRGIVMHTIRYTDSNHIVRILTSHFGLKSFLIRTGKTQKNSVLHLLQPLSLIEFESAMKENSQLQKMKNIRMAHPWQTIPFDPGKSAIVLFINEVLYKTIPDDYANDRLFHFLWNALILLDDSFDEKNFHLWCLLEITRHYGFYPQPDEGRNVYFDLYQGMFVDSKPIHPSFMNEEESSVLMSMLDKEWPQVQNELLHSSLRKSLLEHLVQYIRIHLENLREIKSLHVLHEVFH
jgi:DNA repair protein RecO (recombination protein O)